MVSESKQAPDQPRPEPLHSYLGGFLSYLIPGLGQIYQGRIGKGLLFMVCLWGMFFTGQAMGGWRNVYIPNKARGPEENYANNPRHLPRPIANLLHRWQFMGQFWIGAAAWPAILQYNAASDNPADPFMAPEDPENESFLRNYQRSPVDTAADEQELNELLRSQDKTPDLGWVYTVIAGVLNVLVIYDAFAGPAVLVRKKSQDAKSNELDERETQSKDETPK